MKKIKIAIAEDQILFRKGIISILEKEENFEFTFEANNGQELIDYLKSNQSQLPDVILLDLAMPVLNGVDTMKIVKSDFPSCKVIVLSVYSEDRFVTHLLDLGISGYLLKNSDPEEVTKAINEVLIKELFINQTLLDALSKKVTQKKAKVFIQNDTPSLLSPREIDVLNLICQQKTANEIAEELFISVRTVDGHRNNLLEKTGVRNTAGLVVYAIKNELINPDLLLD